MSKKTGPCKQNCCSHPFSVVPITPHQVVNLVVDSRSSRCLMTITSHCVGTFGRLGTHMQAPVRDQLVDCALDGGALAADRHPRHEAKAAEADHIRAFHWGPGEAGISTTCGQNHQLGCWCSWGPPDLKKTDPLHWGGNRRKLPRFFLCVNFVCEMPKNLLEGFAFSLATGNKAPSQTKAISRGTGLLISCPPPPHRGGTANPQQKPDRIPRQAAHHRFGQGASVSLSLRKQH